MPAPIVIEVTPQAKAVIAKLQHFPVEMGEAIKRGMDQAGNIAWHDIERKRFMGLSPKPFPVSEHRLRNISDRLHTSLFYRAATVETAGSKVAVTGTMGSFGVKYFPWHEYGFSGAVSVKPFFRKNRGGKGRHEVKAYSRRINIPARAPMHHGIEDHRINFQTRIQEQLELEWAKKATGMIDNPDNIFESLQNDIATELMSKALFQGITLPDGTPWVVLTEDEGDIEFLFEKMISNCGLSVVVQSPTAHTASGTRPVPEVQLDPLSIAVSISEAIIFNRSEVGTRVRVMRATKEVISALHTFRPASLNKPLTFTEMLKDRDSHPETGALVATRICLFEVRPYFLIVR